MTAALIVIQFFLNLISNPYDFYMNNKFVRAHLVRI